MIVVYLVVLLMVALIGIHMAKPRFRLQRISAARFFQDLRSTNRSNRRLSLGNPLRSLPLYIQFPLLVLALIALLSEHQTNLARESRGVGVWIIFDTSASMSTRQRGNERISVARDTVEALVTHLNSFSSHNVVCTQLSAFDLELRDMQLATRDLKQVVQTAENLEPRALGTDLTQVQRLLPSEDSSAPESSAALSPADSACTFTHMVVITDQPAPHWVGATEALELIWLDVGVPVPNAGITGLGFARDPLTGRVSEITLDLESYGKTAPAPSLQVLDPAGEVVLDERFTWSQAGRWNTTYEPQVPGLHTVRLLPADAYMYDNQATLEVTLSEDLQVDWRLEDSSLLEQLPWEVSDSDADLRVLSADTPSNGTTPTLLVGAGYRGEGQVEEVLSFVEGHPLLADLNLDVAEHVGIVGTTLPEGFDAVLMGTQGKAWIAERSDPPAVYVPGLPHGDEPLWSFSVTAFFNGVRQLLQASSIRPLYTLTSPQAPEPSGKRVALHPGEGNTARPAASVGSIGDIRPGSQLVESNPTWPVWLSAVAVVFLLERVLFSVGGPRWK